MSCEAMGCENVAGPNCRAGDRLFNRPGTDHLTGRGQFFFNTEAHRGLISEKIPAPGLNKKNTPRGNRGGKGKVRYAFCYISVRVGCNLRTNYALTTVSGTYDG